MLPSTRCNACGCPMLPLVLLVAACTLVAPSTAGYHFNPNPIMPFMDSTTRPHPFLADAATPYVSPIHAVTVDLLYYPDMVLPKSLELSHRTLNFRNAEVCMMTTQNVTLKWAPGEFFANQGSITAPVMRVHGDVIPWNDTVVASVGFFHTPQTTTKVVDGSQITVSMHKDTVTFRVSYCPQHHNTGDVGAVLLSLQDVVAIRLPFSGTNVPSSYDLGPFTATRKGEALQLKQHEVWTGVFTLSNPHDHAMRLSHVDLIDTNMHMALLDQEDKMDKNKDRNWVIPPQRKKSLCALTFARAVEGSARGLLFMHMTTGEAFAVWFSVQVQKPALQSVRLGNFLVDAPAQVPPPAADAASHGSVDATADEAGDGRAAPKPFGDTAAVASSSTIGAHIVSRPVMYTNPHRFSTTIRDVFVRSVTPQHSGSLPTPLATGGSVLDAIRHAMALQQEQQERPEAWGGSSADIVPVLNAHLPCVRLVPLVGVVVTPLGTMGVATMVMNLTECLLAKSAADVEAAMALVTPTQAKGANPSPRRAEDDGTDDSTNKGDSAAAAAASRPTTTQYLKNEALVFGELSIVFEGLHLSERHTDLKFSFRVFRGHAVPVIRYRSGFAALAGPLLLPAPVTADTLAGLANCPKTATELARADNKSTEVHVEMLLTAGATVRDMEITASYVALQVTRPQASADSSTASSSSQEAPRVTTRMVGAASVDRSLIPEEQFLRNRAERIALASSLTLNMAVATPAPPPTDAATTAAAPQQETISVQVPVLTAVQPLFATLSASGSRSGAATASSTTDPAADADALLLKGSMAECLARHPEVAHFHAATREAYCDSALRTTAVHFGVVTARDVAAAEARHKHQAQASSSAAAPTVASLPVVVWNPYNQSVFIHDILVSLDLSAARTKLRPTGKLSVRVHRDSLAGMRLANPRSYGIGTIQPGERRELRLELAGTSDVQPGGFTQGNLTVVAEMKVPGRKAPSVLLMTLAVSYVHVKFASVRVDPVTMLWEERRVESATTPAGAAGTPTMPTSRRDGARHATASDDGAALYHHFPRDGLSPAGGTQSSASTLSSGYHMVISQDVFLESNVSHDIPLLSAGITLDQNGAGLQADAGGMPIASALAPGDRVATCGLPQHGAFVLRELLRTIPAGPFSGKVATILYFPGKAARTSASASGTTPATPFHASPAASTLRPAGDGAGGYERFASLFAGIAQFLPRLDQPSAAPGSSSDGAGSPTAASAGDAPLQPRSSSSSSPFASGMFIHHDRMVIPHVEIEKFAESVATANRRERGHFFFGPGTSLWGNDVLSESGPTRSLAQPVDFGWIAMPDTTGSVTGAMAGMHGPAVLERYFEVYNGEEFPMAVQPMLLSTAIGDDFSPLSPSAKELLRNALREKAAAGRRRGGGGDPHAGDEDGGKGGPSKPHPGIRRSAWDSTSTRFSLAGNASATTVVPPLSRVLLGPVLYAVTQSSSLGRSGSGGAPSGASSRLLEHDVLLLRNNISGFDAVPVSLEASKPQLALYDDTSQFTFVSKAKGPTDDTPISIYAIAENLLATETHFSHGISTTVTSSMVEAWHQTPMQLPSMTDLLLHLRYAGTERHQEQLRALQNQTALKTSVKLPACLLSGLLVPQEFSYSGEIVSKHVNQRPYRSRQRFFISKNIFVANKGNYPSHIRSLSVVLDHPTFGPIGPHHPMYSAFSQVRIALPGAVSGMHATCGGSSDPFRNRTQLSDFVIPPRSAVLVKAIVEPVVANGKPLVDIDISMVLTLATTIQGQHVSVQFPFLAKISRPSSLVVASLRQQSKALYAGFFSLVDALVHIACSLFVLLLCLVGVYFLLGGCFMDTLLRALPFCRAEERPAAQVEPEHHHPTVVGHSTTAKVAATAATAGGGLTKAQVQLVRKQRKELHRASRAAGRTPPAENGDDDQDDDALRGDEEDDERHDHDDRDDAPNLSATAKNDKFVEMQTLLKTVRDLRKQLVLTVDLEYEQRSLIFATASGQFYELVAHWNKHPTTLALKQKAKRDHDAAVAKRREEREAAERAEALVAARRREERELAERAEAAAAAKRREEKEQAERAAAAAAERRRQEKEQAERKAAQEQQARLLEEQRNEAERRRQEVEARKADERRKAAAAATTAEVATPQPAAESLAEMKKREQPPRRDGSGHVLSPSSSGEQLGSPTPPPPPPPSVQTHAVAIPAPASVARATQDAAAAAAAAAAGAHTAVAPAALAAATVTLSPNPAIPRPKSRANLPERHFLSADDSAPPPPPPAAANVPPQPPHATPVHSAASRGASGFSGRVLLSQADPPPPRPPQQQQQHATSFHAQHYYQQQQQQRPAMPRSIDDGHNGTDPPLYSSSPPGRHAASLMREDTSDFLDLSALIQEAVHDGGGAAAASTVPPPTAAGGVPAPFLAAGLSNLFGGPRAAPFGIGDPGPIGPEAPSAAAAAAAVGDYDAFFGLGAPGSGAAASSNTFRGGSNIW